NRLHHVDEKLIRGGGAGVSSLSITSNAVGRLLLLTAANGGNVLLWDVVSRRQLAVLPHADLVGPPAARVDTCGNDGQMVCVTTVALHNFVTGQHEVCVWGDAEHSPTSQCTSVTVQYGRLRDFGHTSQSVVGEAVWVPGGPALGTGRQQLCRWVASKIALD